MMQTFTDSSTMAQRYQDTVAQVHHQMKSQTSDFVMIQRDRDPEFRAMSYSLGLGHHNSPDFVYSVHLENGAQIFVTEIFREMCATLPEYTDGDVSQYFNKVWAERFPEAAQKPFRIWMSRINTEQFLFGHGIIAKHYYPQEMHHKLDFRQIVFGDCNSLFPWEPGYSQLDTPQDVFPLYPFGDKRNKTHEPKRNVGAVRLKFLN